MGNQYYPPDYEYPFQFLNVLLIKGYELNKLELNCFEKESFLTKLLKFNMEGGSIITNLCKNNSEMSQKVALILLKESAKVSQSDQIKPIITSIFEFLEIEDCFSKPRLKWIIGYPNLIYHSQSNSFGSYGINIKTSPIIEYYSPLDNTLCIFSIIAKFRFKAVHVMALLLTMIL